MASGSWLLTTGGAWNSNANWSGASFPNATTETATLATDITADSTVTMGQAISIGSMTFSDNGLSGSAWTVAPGGAYTLTLGTSTITTTTNATISAAVAGTATVTKSGAATLTLTGGSSNTGAWNINQGTIAVTTNAVTATTGLITVGSGGTLTSTSAISKPVTISAGSTGNSYVVANSATQTVSGGTATITSGTAGTVNVGVANASTGGTLTLGCDTGQLNLYGGTVTFNAGTSTVSTTNHNIGFASTPTIITISGNRTISASGSNGQIFFQPYFSTAPAATSTVAVYQDNGTVTSSTSNSTYGIWVGGRAAEGSSTAAYQYYNLTGGTLSTTGSTANMSIGFTVPTVFEATGGTLSTSRVTGIASNPSASVTVNILGGTHTAAGVYGIDFPTNGITAGSTAHQIVNIQNATFTASAFNSGGASTTGLAAINIGAGGVFSTGAVAASLGTGRRSFMLNGGTLTATGAFSFSSGTTDLIMYGTGNKLGSGSGSGGVMSVPLTMATGYGLSSIPLTFAGTGYLGPPILRITGGTGRGAAARAVYDRNTKTITSVVVTCPGSGYSVSDVLTVTLEGPTVANGGCTSLATFGTPVLAANAPDGNIEKVDSGTLTLAVNNTNTGTYTVSNGVLSVGNNSTTGTLGNSNQSNASVASGATLNFNRSDTITIPGKITGSGGISKTSGATPTYTELTSTTSDFTGSVTVTSGALRASTSQALGTGAGSVSVASGASLELTGGITLTRGATIAGTGLGSLGAIRNVSGNNTISGVIALSSTFTIGADAGTLTCSNSSAITGANGVNFIGNGDIDFYPAINTTASATQRTSGTGTTILRATSTYTSSTVAGSGYLGYVGNIAASTNGNFGNTASAVDIAEGAGVRYYGTGASTFSRGIRFTGTTGSTTHKLESNGTGAVTHSGTLSYLTSNLAKTIQLGGTGTADNTVSSTIANNGTGAITVSKTDAGTWILSNTSNTHSGGTSVSTGTLGLSIATWASGAKVTGTGAVTVGSTGRIRTYKGTGGANQSGRHTYASLTFAAGGRIRIGG